jgi:hypothetical protein
MTPRKIAGSAGSRVKLLLGETGDDYVLLLDQDDGNSEWQDMTWENAEGGIPNGLLRQLNNIAAKDRYATHMACNLQGCWFVVGEKRDGTGSYSWWGGVDATGSSAIKECTGEGDELRVSFGDASYNEQSAWLIVQNNCGYWTSPDFNANLEKRLKRIHSRGKRINYVKLFPDGVYFISDAEGTEWNVSGPLFKELKQGGSDPILDVLLAGNGQWVVLRPNRFTYSQGICKRLETKISQFYSLHKQRQLARSREIAKFEREKEEQEATICRAENKKLAALLLASKEQEEVLRRAREEQEAAGQRAREEQERMQRLEERMKEKREMEDRTQQITNKHLKVGESVTVVGFSERPGDATVKKISGVLEVSRAGGNTSIVVRDPRMLSVYDQREEDVETISLLCFAADKYEAAVSMFHCKCRGDICQCKKVFSAQVTLPLSGTNNGKMTYSVGDRVHVKGFADATIIPRAHGTSTQRVLVSYDNGSTFFVRKDQLEKRGQSFVANQVVTRASPPLDGYHASTLRVRPLFEHRGELTKFDDYKCAEKIDLRALKKILEDFGQDRQARKNCMEGLEKSSSSERRVEETLKKLKSCFVLERTAEDLHSILEEQPTDAGGCVVYEVEYEHRDVSFRGRRFARGRSIEWKDGKYPRTATLQGMHSDLRAPLVGKFAHDIDCENSEVRLLCSLASQLGLEELVPTLYAYRDKRKVWLTRISKVHDVSEQDAKRLPNIIISGGRYETWLKAMTREATVGTPACEEVKAFAFQLYAETRSLRDQLLNHGRFRWTLLDRETLEKEGKCKSAIDNLLMPRIIQSCENEVLSIIHRRFEDLNWRVRALVFDGLIVEPTGSCLPLPDAMKEAEKSCFSRGWDVRLVEKPLHGLQNAPMKTVSEARQAMHQLRGRHYSVRGE